MNHGITAFLLAVSVLLHPVEAVEGRAPTLTGGVALTMGPTNGDREARILDSGRFLVAHVTTVGEEAQRLRERIAGLGLAGAITVVESVEPGRLPFIDDTVSLAVIEGPGAPPTQRSCACCGQTGSPGSAMAPPPVHWSNPGRRSTPTGANTAVTAP